MRRWTAVASTGQNCPGKSLGIGKCNYIMLVRGAAEVVDRTFSRFAEKAQAKPSASSPAATGVVFSRRSTADKLVQPRRIAAAAAELSSQYWFCLVLTGVQPLFTPSLINPRTSIGITARPAYVATLEHAGSSLGSTYHNCRRKRTPYCWGSC